MCEWARMGVMEPPREAWRGRMLGQTALCRLVSGRLIREPSQAADADDGDVCSMVGMAEMRWISGGASVLAGSLSGCSGERLAGVV